MMKISVIVPAFNEEKLIGGTLRSIQESFPAFSELGWETELIVCDNNSTDQTAELARKAGATVVFEPVNQIARARNTGARAASGDWLIFIDADSCPCYGLFKGVAKAIQSGRCLAGGSAVRITGNLRLALWATQGWNWISRKTRYLAGSFIFCDAQAFRLLGGFNQKLYVSEEIELSRRLKRLARKTGKQILIVQGHPLLTSDRKLHLYSTWEYLSFLLWTFLKFGTTMKNPQDCYPWYDGRR